MLGHEVGEPIVRFHSQRHLVAVTDRRWMEQLMVNGARFTGDEFTNLFLGERRKAASELLWAHYDPQDRPRYFVIDDDFAAPDDGLIGIPYITELGPFTREAARRLVGRQSIEQLDRPIIRGGLATLDDGALWTPDSRRTLQSVGFEAVDSVARGAISRRFHYGARSVVFVLVPRAGSDRFSAYCSVGEAAVPAPILNQFLLEVGRALLPGQEHGYPLETRLNTQTICSLCGDTITEMEDALVFQRAPRASTRLAVLHRTCKSFSLAGQLLAG